LDEQAHHCDVLNAFKVNTKAVDLAGIEGKKMFLPGEVSTVTSWHSGEISRRHSTHGKRGAEKLHRSHGWGRTERNPSGNYDRSSDFH